MKINYYEVLGVTRSATEAEIRDRFRQLARENHPDRHRGADKSAVERQFQTLTEALNVLTNPVRRRQHDVELQGSGGSGAAASDPAQVAKAYLAKGVKAYKEGDFVAAVENFDMAVKHTPDDAKAHHSLSLAAARVPSMLRQAVTAAEMATQKDPYNAGYFKDAGMLCRRAGLEAKAERYLQQSIELDPTGVEVQLALDEIRRSRESKDAPKKGVFGSLFKKG
ncbi:MAG: DnaJ domain-containing protein [Thermoanaerobaculia bacterium]